MKVSFLFRRGSAFCAAVSIVAVSAHAQAPGVALVRHAPALNGGTIDGSVQQMLAEDVTLSGGVNVMGDLLVPGTPLVRVNGKPTYAGTLDGNGGATAVSFAITLNGAVTLRHVVRRTDAVPMPAVASVPPPSGVRIVALTASGQTAGDFRTLRDLSLGGSVGDVAVPPGSYGEFTANGPGGFTLGVAGATEAATYSFQRLTLNGAAKLQVVGPVLVTVANAVAFNGAIGSAANPDWLTLNVASGGVTLNGDAFCSARVYAPAGAVVLSGASTLRGALACDRLTVGGRATLQLSATTNQPPTIAITAPASGTTFAAPAAFTLSANASDADGVVTRVDFLQDTATIGTAAAAPFQSAVSGLVAGNYTFTARAIDDRGASTRSAPITLNVLGPNQPPIVALTAPPGGALFNVPASIALAATASDPDGTVAKVEFYQSATKLGEAAQAPFSFTWSGMLPGSYALTARAYDNQNATATSAPTTIRVQAALPYVTDFEASEGYVVGSINAQGAWSASGAAVVTETEHHHGARALSLEAATPATQVSQAFPAYTGHSIVFLDLVAKLVAGTTPAAGSVISAESARLTVVRNGAQAEINAFEGDGLGGGGWRPLAVFVAVDAAGRTTDWLRVTLRLDYAAHRWDLYLGGKLVAYDVGFADATAAAFERVVVQGSAAAATLVDEVYVGFENPLFPDADEDGLDDNWERTFGLNPSINDRYGDVDADGLTNLREFLLGTRPNARDSDGDGMPDGWEALYHLDPRVNDANADADGDGVSNLQEFLLGRDPTKGAVPDTTNAVNLRLYLPNR